MKPIPWVKVGETNEITSTALKQRTNNFIFLSRAGQAKAKSKLLWTEEKRTTSINLDTSFELLSLVFPYQVGRDGIDVNGNIDVIFS